MVSYLAPAQYVKALNVIEPGIKDNMDSTVFVTLVVSGVTSALTPVQLAQAAVVGSTFAVKYPQYNVAIQLISDVVVNNLWPFADQLVAVLNHCQAKGMTAAATWRRMYEKMDQFFTFRRANTFWCRAQYAFIKKDPKLWNVVTSTLNNMLNFGTFALDQCEKP